MNTNTVVSQIVAADLSGKEHYAVKLTSTGLTLATSVTDRVIGTLLRGNVTPAAGQTIGTNFFPAADVFLTIGNGIHFVTLGDNNAVVMGDELELGTTDGTYVKRGTGEVAGIAWDSAPANSSGGQINALLLPQSGAQGGVAQAVTQITSGTTGVTLNAAGGSITTVAQNIAAGAEEAFTVTNSYVAAGDTVTVNVASGSVGGTTVAFANAIANGSFQLLFSNLHASVAETGTLVVNFTVHKNPSA